MRVFIALIFLIFLISCSSLYGIKESNGNYLQKHNINDSICFNISKVYVERLRVSKNKYSKLLYQPLQVRVYNDKNILSCFLANCNVGGFPNLKWELEKNLSKNDYCKISTDTIINLKDELSYLLTTNNSAIDFNNASTKVLVCWSSSMGKQNDVLFKAVDEYIQKNKCIVYYVNMDSIY